MVIFYHLGQFKSYDFDFLSVASNFGEQLAQNP